MLQAIVKIIRRVTMFFCEPISIKDLLLQKKIGLTLNEIILRR